MLAGLGLEQAAGSRSGFSRVTVPGKRRFAIGPRVVLRERHDLAPDVLIHDGVLGTLGLVYVVGCDDDREAGTEVASAVDDALYARHLLVTAPPPRDGAAPAPLNVEVVLVTGHEAAVAEVGDTMRDVAARTDALDQIGVSLLRHQPGDDPFAADRTRAFSWLLRATERWLRHDGRGARAVPDPLCGVELRDWRLAGRRKFALADGERFSLVHGRNGSGKSSIAEALELAMVGSITRIEGTERRDDYASVVRHRRPGTSAHSGPEPKVLVSRRSGTEAYTVGKRPSGTWLDAEVEVERNGEVERVPRAATSFRLNQEIMNVLVGTDRAKRGEEFIDAFFPAARPIVDAYEAARGAAVQGVADLQRLMAPLRLAKATLAELARWPGVGGGAGTGDFAKLLDRCLETVALADLAGRARRLGDTVAAARAAHWEPAGEVAGLVEGLGAGPDAATVAALEAEANALLGRLSSAAEAKEAESGGDAAVAERILGRPEAVAALDATGRILEPGRPETEPALGQCLAEAVATDRPVEFGRVGVGRGSWAADLGRLVDAVLLAVESLTGEVSGGVSWPESVEPLTANEEAKQRLAEQDRAEARLNDSFLSVIESELSDAVNELMALCAPARWAYEDLRIEPASDDLRAVGLAAAGDDRMDLRLNTAELNSFALALFLLGAYRLDNALRVVILDDPLQNMDELTVGTMARALARFVRLPPWADEGWRVLLLLHSDESTEHFRSEVSCGYVRLPWLRPGTPAEDTADVHTEPPRHAPGVQDVRRLLCWDD